MKDTWVDEITSVVASKVASEISATSVWINQKQSPLGPRRHCAAVRRRVEEGKDDATILGKRFLLKQDALDEEMRRACIVPPVKVRARDEEQPVGILQRLELELAKVRRKSA